jgi:replicative DNA helicase
VINQRRKKSTPEPIGDFLDKIPPQDLDAERSVLGSIMLVNSTFDDVAMTIQPESFYAAANRMIYLAFTKMYEAGSRSIDIVTLRDELTKRKELDEIGGTEYLLQILETVPHAGHADYYAKIVREKWLLRSLIESSTETLKEAYHGATGAAEIVATAEQRIAAIGDAHTGEVCDMSPIMQEIASLICQRIESDGKSGIGLPTGLRELDDKLNGLCAGHLLILAARPSMGKTALAGDIAAKLVKANHPGMIASLEMTKEELGERLLCAEAKIDGRKLKTGQLDEIDHHYYSEATARMRTWPLYIDDEGYQRCSYLCSKIRRAHRVHKIEWAMIDYLQLVEPDDDSMPREQQVSKISRRFKQLAKELRIPILALSQLNRGVENREDKKPRLADLRESGAIEQDADAVMFLHRPDAYDPDDRPGEADIIIAKNRHGEVGTVTVSWRKKLMTYEGFSPVDTDDIKDF